MTCSDHKGVVYLMKIYSRRRASGDMLRSAELRLPYFCCVDGLVCRCLDTWSFSKVKTAFSIQSCLDHTSNEKQACCGQDILQLLSDDVKVARVCFGGIMMPISTDAFSPWLVSVGLSESEANALQIQ